MATPDDIGRSDARIVAPIGADLLDAPLEYVLADHARQRNACAALQRFAAQRFAAAAEAEELSAYFADDLALHRRDEEESLFPALRRRARKEDGLDDTLTQLQAEHGEASAMERAIVNALRQPAEEGAVALKPATRSLMRRYVKREHRHIAVENGVVLVIAGIRLNAAELKIMSAAMKARRRAQD